MTLQDVIRLIRPLSNRVTNLARRAVLQLVDDSQKLQVLQVKALAGETRDGVEHVQPYGFSSVPPAGADVVLLSVGGRSEHALAIAAGHKAYRIRNRESGEVTVYDKNGSTITLKANGDIEVNAAGNVILNGGAIDVAKVGSSVTGQAGPYPVFANVADGSSTVKVP